MATSEAPAGRFVLVCPEKSVKDTGDQRLERAFQSLALKQHLDAMRAELPQSDAAYLPGAGVAFSGGCVQGLLEDRWLSVFVGAIDNYAYLVKKYCLEEAGLDPKSPYLLETVRAMSCLSDAELVALLLKKLGPTFMSKLRGRFAFAVFDAHTGRVLAVRDTAGTHPLWQAHLEADNSLVVACGPAPPLAPAPAAAGWAEIRAGEYKFGWRSAPLAYMASEDAVASRQEEARCAALEALLSASVPVAAPAGPARRSTSFSRPRPMPPRLSRASTSDAYAAPARRSFQAEGPLMRAAASDAGAVRAPAADGGNRARVYGRASSTIERPSGGSWRAAESVPLSRQSSSYVPPHRRNSIAGAPAPPPQLDSRRSMSSSWRRDGALDAARAPRVAASPPQSAALAINPPRAAAPAAQLASSSAFFRPAAAPAPPPPPPPLPDDSEDSSSLSTNPSESTATATTTAVASSRAPSRSQPIPIATPRTSRDSRASASWRRPAMVPDAHALGRITTGIAEGSAEPDSGAFIELNAPELSEAGRAANTSEESVIGTGESSSECSALSGGGYRATDVAKKTSSMLFEWSDAGSVQPSSVANSAADALSVGGSAPTPAPAPFGVSPSLRHALLPEPPTRRQTAEAQALQSSVAFSLSGGLAAGDAVRQRSKPLWAESGEAGFGELLQWRRGSGSPPRAGEECAAAPPELDLAAEAARAARRGRRSGGGMKNSPSFPEALAQLLDGRAASPAAPARRSGSPREQQPSPLRQAPPALTKDASDASRHGPALPAARLMPTVVEHHSSGSASAAEEERPGAAAAGAAQRSGDTGEGAAGEGTLQEELLERLVAGEADPQVKCLLASLVLSSPCALCIVDATAPDQPVVYVNALFEEKTGYAWREVVGRNCRFLQAPPGAARKPSFASIALKRAISMGRSHVAKILNFSKSGQPLWNELSLLPVRGDGGAVTHFIGMHTFTAAPYAAAGAVSETSHRLVRGASHQCLQRAGGREAAAQQRLMFKSASHTMLTALGGGSVAPAAVALNRSTEVV